MPRHSLPAAVAGLALSLVVPRLVHAQAADSTLEGMAGRLEGLIEQVQTLQSDTDKLKKIKITGYIQARYEASQLSDDSVKVIGNPPALTPANQDRFYIRRARVKVNWDPIERTQAVLQIDGGSDRTIRLLDAYVQVSDPWTSAQRHQLTFGQFNTPFGYELERSSSLRELPERSRAENVLFPGERDRGVKLVDRWTDSFESVIGLLNGGGINSVDFPTTDPTAGKDLVGRVRYSSSRLDLAVSGYDGKGVVPLTGRDVEVDRTRYGADAQLYWEFSRLGGGTLRGEFYTGEDANPDSAAALLTKPSTAVPSRVLKPGADPSHLDSEFVGWYVMLVQNLGDRIQGAVRYDVYDRNVDLSGDDYHRWSAGINWFYDGYTRFTFAYDIPDFTTTPGVPSPGDQDNLFTFQAQFKF